MNDVVIRAVDLKKVYRLYTRPSYRFRDMFGLLGDKPNAYTEHAALAGVTLSIRRGEKVAIIGRNGAGKSTLLKLVTGVVEPSSGILEVGGRFQALLQIGTGFHPDFTGRENVIAYFAQLGLSGAEARRKCAEVVDFAELEEYIDQPIKTYSTGMAVRLMFSASTAIHPDLLVLDEVLGVGDAYFANKSYERIVRMCEDEGTTLLLVTHDVYSAVKVCSRVIWIDRGRVVMDSESSVVVKAYEDSIRQQEEHRMRLKTQAALREASAVAARDRGLLVEIQARENRPQPSPLLVAEVELLLDGEPVSTLILGPGTPESGPSAHLVRPGTCWGEPGTWHDRTAVPLNNYGSPFHKAAVMLDSPVHPLSIDPDRLAVRVTGWSDEPCDLVVRGFSGSHVIEFGRWPSGAGQWQTATLMGQVRGHEGGTALGTINTTGTHGTGTILIERVDLLDAGGQSAVFVEHGRPASIVIDYRVQDPAFDGPAQVIVALYRDGVNTACRFVTDDLRFSARERPTGRIHLDVPRFNLGLGSYSVGVMIAEPNYLNGDVVQFYTVNPGVYASLTRVLEFTVTGKGLVATNTAWVGEGHWSLRDA
jgi:lipopolysaccharide transport system ATP-binding protein